MMRIGGKRRRTNVDRFFFLFSLSLISALVFFWGPREAFSINNKTCLECHGSRDILKMTKKELLDMVIPTPDKQEVKKGNLTLYVDEGKFRSTVHHELQCTDCHTDIKTIPHPQRMAMVNCAQCHDQIVGQYTKSKHARASDRFCYECHNPHATTSFRELSQQERIGICLKCHEKGGHRWLPQRELHFQYLECTVCHSPKAEKGVFYYLTALRKEKQRVNLSYQDLAKFAQGYNGDVAKAIDRNGNGIVDVQEINRFIAKLKERGVQSPQLEEKVLILKPYHNFTDETKEIKDCTLCHVSDAPFYSQVVLQVPEKQGGWRTVKMEKTIVGKMPRIPSKDRYYTTVHGKNGVECIDCHADLTVFRVKEGFQVKGLKTPVCANCHAREMSEYENSLHAKVSEKICFGCHDPHSGVPFKELSVEQRQAICAKCHNPDQGHDWLPQRDLHFKVLECTMCHAPQAEKGIVFFLEKADEEGHVEPLTYRAITALVGGDRPDVIKLLDTNNNGFLEDREVLSFLQVLKEKSPREIIQLGVKVLVLKPSHNYTKGTPAKDCALCHSAEAGFYSKLIMEIPEEGGGLRTLPMDKSILAGMHAISATGSFYLLGEGRLTQRDISDFLFMVRKIGYKWLDAIGMLFVLGGVGFVGLHAFIRISTIKLRKRRR
jgi:predicted CXXCH cytochrome family protein